MKAVDVKIMLLRRGLSFAEMADRLHTEDGPSKRSLAVMIADLLYGRRWYPNLAKRVRSEFGISVNCPASYQPVRQALKHAA